MAVTGPMVGSSAKSETGKEWMAAAGTSLRLSIPFWMSTMIGRSVEVTITLGQNLSYDRNDLINKLRALGSTPAVVVISGDLVAQNTGVPCLEFPSNLPNEYVILRNNATIYGRGGNGGQNGAGPGYAGGPGILNSFGTKLRIENNGSICGGGGGGGGVRVGGSNIVAGGSGGRPFGLGGAANGRDSINGINASISAPGGTNHNSRYNVDGGAGGNVGQAGARSKYNGGQGSEYDGGAAGAAVYGNAPSWTKLGNIYGSRV